MPMPPPLANGPRGPWWTAWENWAQWMTTQMNSLTQGAQQTCIVDSYGNTIVIIGQLNQTVTIGASHGIAGVQVGTNLGLPGSGVNAGLAWQQDLVTTTITTTEGSETATVASASGMVDGMVIGAADVSDPSSGVATPAIVPGTTISSISGTTLTLSANAAESGTAIFCAACWFRSLQGVTYP